MEQELIKAERIDAFITKDGDLNFKIILDKIKYKKYIKQLKNSNIYVDFITGDDKNIG